MTVSKSHKMVLVPKTRRKTLIMGILNVTPDSFSDGGSYCTVEQAVKQAIKLVKDGADILDIGGESTRPGFIQVTEEEEIKRVTPVIAAIRKELDIPISVDTYKAAVADQALEAGATIINDIWGGLADPNMGMIAARHQVPIILMHNRHNRAYQNLISDIKKDLLQRISEMKAAGVKDEHIWLDPGIGFAKSYTDNLDVMAHLGELVSLGYPIVLGTSRKSFIGLSLDLPVEERLEGTLATICYGIQQGCQIMRVHDVKEAARTAQMMDTMLSREG